MDILSPRDCSLCVFVCAFVYPYLITNVPIDTEAQFKCIGLLSVFIKGSDSIQGLAEDHAMISRLPPAAISNPTKVFISRVVGSTWNNSQVDHEGDKRKITFFFLFHLQKPTQSRGRNSALFPFPATVPNLCSCYSS